MSASLPASQILKQTNSGWQSGPLPSLLEDQNAAMNIVRMEKTTDLTGLGTPEIPLRRRCSMN